MMRFAKQSAKHTMTTLSFFWHKNVHFAKKRVPLYSIIRLLERDEEICKTNLGFAIILLSILALLLIRIFSEMRLILLIP